MTLKNFWKKVDKTDTCWLWGEINEYGRVKIDDKFYATHRLSYTIHKGEIPEGMIICHHCDIKNCVNPEHLYAGTHKQNAKDKYSRNRSGQSNIKYSDILGILAYSKGGMNNKDIAIKYGISASSVWRLVTGRSWNDVTGIEKHKIKTNDEVVLTHNRLTVDKIYYIAYYLKNNRPQREIANEIGIPLPLISRIARGLIHSNITGILPV